jgi:uncharacterized membrane protein YadS
MVAGVAISRRRAATRSGVDAEVGGKRPPLVPLFVVGFLAAVVLRSTGLLPDAVLDAAVTVEKVLFTIALAALGMGVRVVKMRQLGGRPLILGLISWVLVATAAYVATTIVN